MLLEKNNQPRGVMKRNYCYQAKVDYFLIASHPSVCVLLFF